MTRLVRRRIIFGSDGKLDPSIVPASGGGVSDGDKGDISVSGSGATWTIDAGVVTTTKLGGDITTAGKALLDDADAAAQRTTLGLGSAALEATTYFALASHNQAASTINSGTIATARLGSGTADSTTYLRGDSTWQIITTGGSANAEGRDHVVPSLSNYTWVNQGSATAVQTTYGISMLAPGESTDTHRMLVKSTPSTPYSIIIRFHRSVLREVNYVGVTLLWRASGSGAFQAIEFGETGGTTITGVNWTNATTYNSAASGFTSISRKQDTYWVRLRDDSTDRFVDISGDGDNWVNIDQRTRTNYITPDQVGFGIHAIQTSTPRYSVGLTILSWEEA